MNSLDRVILLHDIDSSERIGMVETGSRYLLSWEVVDKGIEEAKKKSVEFEPINRFGQQDNKKNSVRITVDDGGGSSLKIAELLAKKNIKAYFFIPTKFIGNKGFLTKKEIADIYTMGHIMGSHSHSHPNPFCELRKSKIFEEVQKSKLIIEDIIGEKIKIFSVPGGEIRKDTLITLSDKALGLDEIYISTPYQGKSYSNSKFQSQIYGRMTIERNMSYQKVCDYITGKGWRSALINYQVRRFRRELIYKFNHLMNHK